MFPKSNTLSNRNYKAKKIFCLMGMACQKLHSCSNDCIFYIKESVELICCPKCGLPRYKVKDGDQDNIDEIIKHDPPLKEVWYL